MIKEVQYAGYSTEPSDYECADGQLALSLNLINEDNQLKPLFQPATLFKLEENQTIVYLHKTEAYTHYIVRNTDTGNISWTPDGVSFTTLYESDGADFRQVTSVGNTLILLTGTGVQYFLWKENEYISLGTGMPEIDFKLYLYAHDYEWGLDGLEKNDSDFLYSFNLRWDTHINQRTGGLNASGVTALMAKINEFVSRFGTKKGYFTQPFFARYAYRLYDGSLVMHSAPMLMVCATRANPILYYARGGEDDENNIPKYWQIAGKSFELCWYVENYSEIKGELEKWKDIITSVDIFVSSPIYTYDQSIEDNDASDDYSLEVKDFSDTSYFVAKNDSNGIYKDTYSNSYTIQNSDGSKDGTAFSSFLFTQEEIQEKIIEASNFYLLKSIKIDKLKNLGGSLKADKDYLDALQTKESMSDDYRTHDKLAAQKAHSYNGRLHLSNVSRLLFQGFACDKMAYYMGNSNLKAKAKVYVYIKENNKDIIVESEEAILNTDVGLSPLYYLFYPNPNAYKIAVVVSGTTINIGGLDYDGDVVYGSNLTAHDFLDGAYFFNGWNGLLCQDYLSVYMDENKIIPSTAAERLVQQPNKLYTSEVNNPFYFPVTNINTIGTGTILGISSAAKALSQGQFGQFPLYAFTDEGVWALEVSTTGTYSAKQPITRDVCTNADGITQLDSAVLFPTDRGIMLISGSNAQCITDTIFAEAPFNVLDLPHFDQLHAKLGHTEDTCLPIKPFLAFLAGCRMVYDYVHQRVFVFNPSTDTDGNPVYTYAYVYSLKSQRWGMTYSSLLSGLNSYPDALAMTHDSRLVSFSTTDETESSGLFVTRPLKLEAADVLKTISTLIQRGHFQRGDVATVLYASRDLYTWHLIWSSKDHYLRGFRGTPYKYFRLAGLTTLTEGKSLFGASVAFEARHTNNLR